MWWPKERAPNCAQHHRNVHLHLPPPPPRHTVDRRPRWQARPWIDTTSPTPPRHHQRRAPRAAGHHGAGRDSDTEPDHRRRPLWGRRVCGKVPRPAKRVWECRATLEDMNRCVLIGLRFEPPAGAAHFIVQARAGSSRGPSIQPTGWAVSSSSHKM